MRRLSWLDILRLGLVQMALGSIVVLTTSVLNRVMVVELALPAVLPGALVALYYAVQLSRPRWGFRSDAGGRRTPWIVGGMAILALGGFGATVGTVLLASNGAIGTAVSVLSFMLIGGGGAASGTSLLALLAAATAPERRAAAATITWMTMILGIAVTAGTVGALLDPYSHMRLLLTVAFVCTGALVLTALAIRGIERRLDAPVAAERATPFLEAFAEIWAERRARRFALFVFLSMTAYFMQELILEPFSGHVFGYTPGQSTSMAGLQHGGVFLGMLTVGVAASGLKLGSLRFWTGFGCLASAASLLAIAAAGLAGPGAPLLALVLALGFSNGVFAVAAIGSMMENAGKGRSAREGTRMGLFGAAQAVAAGFGGLVGAAAADAMRRLVPTDAEAYGAVFAAEAALFLLAAFLAFRTVVRAPALSPGE